MAQHRVGVDRNQTTISCLEHSIALDNMVRIIDAFVDILDFNALGFSIALLEKFKYMFDSSNFLIHDCLMEKSKKNHIFAIIVLIIVTFISYFLKLNLTAYQILENEIKNNF